MLVLFQHIMTIYGRFKVHFLKRMGLDKFYWILLIIFIFLDSFVQAFFEVLGDGSFSFLTISIISKIVLLFLFLLIFIEHDKTKSLESLIAHKKNAKYKMKANVNCSGCLYCNQFLDSEESNRVYCCFYEVSELLSEDKSRCKWREASYKNQ